MTTATTILKTDAIPAFPAVTRQALTTMVTTMTSANLEHNKTITRMISPIFPDINKSGSQEPQAPILHLCFKAGGIELVKRLWNGHLLSHLPASLLHPKTASSAAISSAPHEGYRYVKHKAMETERCNLQLLKKITDHSHHEFARHADCE